MKSRYSIASALLLGFLAFAVAPATAQQPAPWPKVHTQVSPTSGTVGEHFTLTIAADVPSLDALQVLPLFDTQTTWTALGQPQVIDSANASVHTRTFTYTIVPFETGREAVPKVAVTYAPKGGATSATVLSQDITVTINSVLSGNGSASALRDARPPVSLPVPPAVVWTGGIILVLVIMLLAWWLWRQYSARLRRLIGRALTPPEIALKKLSELETERLIEHKKIKEFYTRLSDVMREYLQTAYGIQAMDLTSTELLRELDELAPYESPQNSPKYRTAVARLTEMLDEADLVKFARYMPEVSRCRKALDLARTIVDDTRYRFQPSEPAPGGSPPPSAPAPANPSSPPPPPPQEVSR